MTDHYSFSPNTDPLSEELADAPEFTGPISAAGTIRDGHVTVTPAAIPDATSSLASIEGIVAHLGALGRSALEHLAPALHAVNTSLREMIDAQEWAEALGVDPDRDAADAEYTDHLEREAGA